MTNKPKKIGTETESAVVAYLRTNGFPAAERRALAGTSDLGDVVGIGQLVIEVKGGKAAATASDGQVDAWLEETDRERLNARANLGVLVMKRSGIGPDRAGLWWAVMYFADVNPAAALASASLYVAPVRMHLRDAVLLLRAHGYGTPLGEAA